MTNEKRISELKRKIIKINSVSSSFCSAKWLQTTLYLQNGFNHSCHHPAPHKIPIEDVQADPAVLHNSKFKKSQRELMLKGERPKECDYCWNIEDLNKDYFSDRHYKTADYWAWDRFDEIANSDPNINVYPSYLEVSFSNACNFACIYCSPEISSKWMEDIQQNGHYPVQNGSHHLDYLKQIGRFPYSHNADNPYVTAFWKWFPDALPHLKVLRITGGEPTMSKDLWKLLDFLSENPHPDLELAINTNLCVPDSLIDKLIHHVNNLKGSVKRFDIYTSLESVGPQAEYARDGLDFQAWQFNIRKLLDKTDTIVSIMTTVNILSLPTFVDFIELVMNLRKDYNNDFAYNRIPVSINYLRWPPHLQCTILDKDIRAKYSDKILQASKKWLKYYTSEKYARIYLEEWDQIQRFCEYLTVTESLVEFRSDFVTYIQEYDLRRKKTFSLIFPEFKNLLSEWNV